MCIIILLKSYRKKEEETNQMILFGSMCNFRKCIAIAFVKVKGSFVI